MIYNLIDDLGEKFQVELELVNAVPITKQPSTQKGSQIEESSEQFNKKIIKIESLVLDLYTQYVPKSSAGTIVRFINTPIKSNLNSDTSFSMYTTGSISSPGRKNIENIKLNFFQYTNILKHIQQPFFKYDPITLKIIPGYPRKIPLSRFVKTVAEISNIVLTCEFPHKYIHLDEIYRLYREHSKYYPRKYPGLDIKFMPGEIFDFGFTYSIYSSGKINMLGLVNKTQIDWAFKKLVKIISKSYTLHKLIKSDYAWKYSNDFLKNRNVSLEIEKSKKKSNLSPLEIEKKGTSLPNKTVLVNQKGKKSFLEKKNKSNNPMTSKERNFRFNNPEKFFFEKKGIVKKRSFGVNIFDHRDFKNQIQKKYLQKNHKEMKIFNEIDF